MPTLTQLPLQGDLVKYVFLPILWTRLGEIGLFAFEGVTQRTLIIEQGDGALNVLPSVPLGAPATGP